MRDDQVRKLVDQAMDAVETAHRRAEALHDALRQEVVALEDQLDKFTQDTRHKFIQLSHEVKLNSPFQDLTDEEVEEAVEIVGIFNPKKYPEPPQCRPEMHDRGCDCGCVELHWQTSPAEPVNDPAQDTSPYIAEVTQKLLDQGFSHGSIKEMICSGNCI